MALTPAEKKEIINKFGASASDTGSPEAQVALLSKRIEQVTEHLQTNKTTTTVVDCFCS
jgi:small subunit ribosomal protein S15